MIIYNGKSAIDKVTDIVVIATGINAKTRNPKTGDMIQVWILLANQHPIEAINDGTDRAICGFCPHRKYNGRRTCYVNPMGINAVYKKYLAGGYPVFNFKKHGHLFNGRKVRFGAYGDPVNIPYILVKAIANRALGHTGYTHQWNKNEFQAYQEFFQASCDNLADFINASSLGWSTFRVASEQGAKYDNEISCQGGKKTNCFTCSLCDGNAERQRHIMINAHGRNAKLVAG